jgi:hypothetical protein
MRVVHFLTDILHTIFLQLYCILYKMGGGGRNRFWSFLGGILRGMRCESYPTFTVTALSGNFGSAFLNMLLKFLCLNFSQLPLVVMMFN